MKKQIITIGALGMLTLSSIASITFTFDQDVIGQALDNGFTTSDTLATGPTTTYSYSAIGLTIDADGAADDSLSFNVVVTGSDDLNINAGGFFGVTGGDDRIEPVEMITFSIENITATLSGGEAYVSSAEFTHVGNNNTPNSGFSIDGESNTFSPVANANTPIVADSDFVLTGEAGALFRVADVSFTVAVDTVPEPSSAVLVGLGAFALIARRKR